MSIVDDMRRELYSVDRCPSETLRWRLSRGAWRALVACASQGQLDVKTKRIDTLMGYGLAIDSLMEGCEWRIEEDFEDDGCTPVSIMVRS